MKRSGIGGPGIHLFLSAVLAKEEIICIQSLVVKIVQAISQEVSSIAVLSFVVEFVTFCACNDPALGRTVEMYF